MYHNVSLNKVTGTYQYRLDIAGHALVETGFPSAAEAAWQCDLARHALKSHLRRSRPYNFPERIATMSDSEAALVSPRVLSLISLLATEHSVQPAQSPLEKLDREINEARTKAGRAEELVVKSLAATSAIRELDAARVDGIDTPVSLKVWAEKIEDFLPDVREAAQNYRTRHAFLLGERTRLVPPVDLTNELGNPADTATE